MTSIRIGKLAADSNSVAKGNLEVPLMTGGADASIPTIIINGEKDGPIVNVHAGIHGDEFEGIEATWRLIDRIKPQTLTGTIVATPIVHTAAYRAGTRESPVDGKNLARVFPGDAAGTTTDKIAYTFFNEVVLKCDYVIGLHSGGFKYRFHPLIEYYEGFDAEVGQRARSAAEAFCVGPFDIMQRIGNPPKNITCTSEASRHGIPGIEGEMWGEGRCPEESTEQYAEAVMSVFDHLGMLVSKGSGAPPEIDKRRIRHVESTDVQVDEGGFFLPSVRLEDSVAKDQRIGVTKAESGEVTETVETPVPGFVAAIRTFPMIRAGEWAVRVETELGPSK
jgi:predicted deacylase